MKSAEEKLKLFWKRKRESAAHAQECTAWDYEHSDCAECQSLQACERDAYAAYVKASS